MNDRKEFEAARSAGLAIRQQRRIETREELRRRTRREVAEEIAAAIEGEIDDPFQCNNDVVSGLQAARVIAREIGAR